MKTRLIDSGTRHSEYTIGDLKGMGWTDKQIIDEGFALRVPMQFSEKPSWDMSFIGATDLVTTFDTDEKGERYLYEFVMSDQGVYYDANGLPAVRINNFIEKHPSITKMTEDSEPPVAKFSFTGFDELPSWDKAYLDATHLLKLNIGLYVFAETNEYGDMLTNEGDEFENWTLVSERPVIEPVKVNTKFGPATLYVGEAPEKPAKIEPVNRYKREILPGVWIDFYDIAACYEITDHAMAHALKKILAIGDRGHKDEAQDRSDIHDSVVRSNERYEIFKDK